ncbi:uncharacterized protein GGS22DRAFT_158159 [Annulohypoxylon maeteangense]|uniref:uncharacterized protein n=1 Tax=Annulohypoxylon maeteangense TaxID=1927788 RepID=UPI002008DA44|nr:uncharacterized protein GGS22DRAFT_158159 [Annulohypoxylon maeteangense]KAI0886560.1 hypothetical protein GGS22DRAFT_158159 [Annulohypoxylon maeteangense]
MGLIMDLYTRNPASFSKSLVPKATTPPLISHVAFHAIIWTGVSLCILAFSGRVAIRVICFRRLFLEDYVMLVSLIILIATAVIIQTLVPYSYNISQLRSGFTSVPSAQFLEDAAKGLHGHVALMVMGYVGIWLIKFSFLTFLFRLGDKVTKYRVFWWIVLVFNIAAGVTEIGIIPYQCLLSPVERIVVVCTTRDKRIFSNLNSIVSCLLDALGDVMIICFPVYVLWNVRIDVRKKIILTALFSLVVFTVLVTIVRGSVFGGAYIPIDQPEIHPVNVAWIWFWFSIEYIISFIVACLISFRCLFTQIESDIALREARAPDWNHQAIPVYRPEPTGFREKVKIFRKSVHDTLMTLEGFTRVDSEVFVLQTSPDGTLTLNFEGDEGSNTE